MASDHSLYEALVAEMIEPSVFAIALARGIDEGQVAGRARSAFKEPRLQCDGDILGKANADKPASRHSRAARNQCHRVGSRHRLAVRPAAQCREAEFCLAVHRASRGFDFGIVRVALSSKARNSPVSRSRSESCG